MKVFICGGGSGEQTRRALHRLNEVIRHDLPCLYIPLAMEEEYYDGCFEWIAGELAGVEIPAVEMIRSAEELAGKRLTDYSFLFIGGGNTFKLLNDIKRVHMFEPIREYLQNGGTAFGGSAGDDFRLFKLNRMDGVKETDRSFECRNVPMPDLSNGKVFPGGISVKALFEPDMKWRLVEEFGPHCFTDANDGRLLFTADYTDMDNLVSWILTFGAKAEVLEPAEARDRIRKIAGDLGKIYGG